MAQNVAETEEFQVELARRLQAFRDAGPKDSDQTEHLLAATRELRAQVAELEAHLKASEWLRENQGAELQQLQKRVEELEGLFEALASVVVEPGEEKQRSPTTILRQVAARLSSWEKDKADSQGQINRLTHSLAIQQVDDDLDDAASRRNALRRLDEALEVSKKAGVPLFCLFVELEAESALRDKSGSIAADFLLVQIAQRLRLNLRHRDVLLRYDSASFVLLTDAGSAQHAYQHAKRLHESLSNDPVELGSKRLKTPIRIGIVGTAAHKSADDLLRKAKELLRKAKSLPEPIVIDPALVRGKR